MVLQIIDSSLDVLALVHEYLNAGCVLSLCVGLAWCGTVKLWCVMWCGVAWVVSCGDLFCGMEQLHAMWCGVILCCAEWFSDVVGCNDVVLFGAVCFRGFRRPCFKPWTSDLESWCSDIGPLILDLRCGWAGAQTIWTSL